MKHRLLLHSVALLVATSAAARSGQAYQPLFHQVAVQYWDDTGHSWHLLHALAQAESSFRPAVVSHVGAVGLLQVMPATWQEIRQQAIPSLGTDLTDPRDNIRAGGHYLRQMYNLWRAERPDRDRILLALASYNAGAGHLLTAQRLAGGANLFAPIAEQLPEVTGSHAAGTIRYAHKIVHQYTQARPMLWLEPGGTQGARATPQPSPPADSTPPAAAPNPTMVPPPSPAPAPVVIEVVTAEKKDHLEIVLAALLALLQLRPRPQKGEDDAPAA